MKSKTQLELAVELHDLNEGEQETFNKLCDKRYVSVDDLLKLSPDQLIKEVRNLHKAEQWINNNDDLNVGALYNQLITKI